MRKHLLFSAALSLMAVAGAQAQEAYEYQSKGFFDTVFTTPDGVSAAGVLGTFNKVSANGEYAVGCDDQYASGVAYLWRWSDPTNITFVSVDAAQEVLLSDVTNDGLMVGAIYNSETDRVEPAIKTIDGDWEYLPVPEDYSSKTQSVSCARAVTPDGKVILGNYYYSAGMIESPFGGTMEKTVLVPAYWTLNAEGKYELTDLRELGQDGFQYYDANEKKLVDGEHDVEVTSCYMYDISNDGKTMVGMVNAGTGGQNPTVIRDGKLIYLYDCDNPDTYTFDGGICSSIDANGNVYGYYSNGDTGEGANFMFTADNEMIFTSAWYICATKDGQKFTQSGYGLSNIMDCSEDGKVIVGGTTESYAGSAVNGPGVAYVEKVTDGVDKVEALKNNVGISYSGNVLIVTGKYDRADIYDAQGALIATGGQGKAFSMAGQPAGAYIVKVTTANGVKSYKFAR